MHGTSTIGIFALITFVIGFVYFGRTMLFEKYHDKKEERKKLKFRGLHDWYANVSYFEQYRSTICFVIVISVLELLLISFLYIESVKSYYRIHWPEERFNLYVIPFAGDIMTPPAGMTKFDFFLSNLSLYENLLLKDVVTAALEPVHIVAQDVKNIYATVASAINTIEQVLIRLVDSIEAIIEGLWNRGMNVVTLIQQMLLRFLDAFSRIEGAMAVLMYSIISFFDFMVSFFQTLVNAAIGYLMTMVAVIVVLMALAVVFEFLMIPIGLMITVILSISIPLALIVDFLVNVMGIPQQEFPKPPNLNPLVDTFRGVGKLFKKKK